MTDPAGSASCSPTGPTVPAARLREALLAAGFTHDGVVAALGPVAHAALGRNETTPALRRTTDGSPLATLTRLFLLQHPVSRADADRALPGLVDQLHAAGVVRASGGEVAALLDCRPYATDASGTAGDLWVVSDLTPGLDGASARVSADHVLGVSRASTSLAQLTRRTPVARALDLGTGCGVQALHLATHSDRVVATDVNPRALWLARLTLALNAPALPGSATEVREGSYFDPVAGEAFDLITTNPPFVISPPGGERLVYRDSGLPGDQVVADIVRTAPDHLAPGGWCQVLANWAITHDRPWDERLADWLDPARTDAWVVQREEVDPAAYVELWLADAGWQGRAEYTARYDAWLRWFEDEGIAGVGFGWVNLRRRPADAPGEGTVRCEEWPWEVEQPVGEQVAAFGRAVDHLDARAGADRDQELLAERFVLREDVQQETYAAPGAADPEAVVLRQQRGLRRAHSVGTELAAFLGACDGELTAGQIADAVAELLDADPEEVRAEIADAVPGLLQEGFLTPAG